MSEVNGESREAQLLHRTGELERQLEEARRELTSFAYSVSHDLRAPLRHLDGFSGLLATELRGRLDPKAAHYLEVIQNAAQRMGKLMDALLSYSRLSASELRRVPLDLNRMLQAAMAPYQDLPGRALRWEVGALAPLEGDPQMIAYLLHALLDNAVKFTRDQPEAVIEITPLEGLEEQVGFRMRDNGAGFDQAHVHRLFGIFQRLHREEAFEGVGLGLALARRIVARHGGHIWAEGAVNQGATLFVTFPASHGDRT
jgi:light-regulated signal transduction histidine kinase (bacteriophytochrome)